jgi:hypothetical protein
MICEFSKANQVRKNTDCLFVDSGILAENRDIERIVRFQKIGDIVSPPDELEDVDTTLSNTLEWYEKSKNIHTIDKMCFVLQGKRKEDYLKCLEEMRNTIEGIEYVGLGGLICKPDLKIKDTLTLLPRLHEEGLKVHIFGLGVRWLDALLEYNPFSFDSSTPIRDAISFYVYDNNFTKTCLSKSGVACSKLRTMIGQVNNYQVKNYITNFIQKPKTTLNNYN